VTFFGPGPAFYLSFFPGPGSNGCSWGRAARGAGRCPPRYGGKPRRGRHTLLRLTGPPPVGAPHEQGWSDVYTICSPQSRHKFAMRASRCTRADCGGGGFASLLTDTHVFRLFFSKIDEPGKWPRIAACDARVGTGAGRGFGDGPDPTFGRRIQCRTQSR
jgi:hypothetical protein